MIAKQVLFRRACIGGTKVAVVEGIKVSKFMLQILRVIETVNAINVIRTNKINNYNKMNKTCVIGLDTMLDSEIVSTFHDLAFRNRCGAYRIIDKIILLTKIKRIICIFREVNIPMDCIYIILKYYISNKNDVHNSTSCYAMIEMIKDRYYSTESEWTYIQNYIKRNLFLHHFSISCMCTFCAKNALMEINEKNILDIVYMDNCYNAVIYHITTDCSDIYKLYLVIKKMMEYGVRKISEKDFNEASNYEDEERNLSILCEMFNESMWTRLLRTKHITEKEKGVWYNEKSYSRLSVCEQIRHIMVYKLRCCSFQVTPEYFNNGDFLIDNHALDIPFIFIDHDSAKLIYDQWPKSADFIDHFIKDARSSIGNNDPNVIKVLKGENYMTQYQSDIYGTTFQLDTRRPKHNEVCKLFE